MKFYFRIQKNFPLAKKPFLNIANELHTTEERVLEILNEAKRDGIIRQTSLLFLIQKKLGYKSSLVAFEIEEKDIPNACKNFKLSSWNL